MSKKLGRSNKLKTEVLIAVLLAVLMVFGVSVMVLVEKLVPDNSSDGEIANVNTLKITEICSSNKSIIISDDGQSYDYIELYNGGETFNLSGYAFAVGRDDNIVYTFGDLEFKAKSYMAIFLDGVNIPFKLNRLGEEYVSLVTKDGVVVDSFVTQNSLGDEVMLWNGNEFVISKEASPGFSNTKEGIEQFKQSLKETVINLSINEIFVENAGLYPDGDGDFCDIVEIKNNSQSVINANDYFISDDVNDRFKCQLPEIQLAPEELLVVFVSGKGNGFIKDCFHTDFKLSVGESVVISAKNNYVSQEIVNCGENLSLSMTTTENGVEYSQMKPSIGFENNEAGIEDFINSRINNDYPLVINEILFSQDDMPYNGKLRDVIELCNISETELNLSGWYISDDDTDPYKYALEGKTLQPNECLLLYAEKGQGENICNFALSSGEGLYLTGPDFKRSESVSCASAGQGKSRVRITENGTSVYINGEISLGFQNHDYDSYFKDIRPDFVEISEVMAFNRAYLPGPYSTYHDFVELHNRTSNEIDLTGWYLSDESEEPRKGSLDGVKIPANDYVVIILSSDGINTPSGYKVLNFGISSSGEQICLSKGDEIIDCAIIPSLALNTAYGRANGKDNFSVLAYPTPDKSNSDVASVAKKPTPNLDQGVYSQSQITLELEGEGKIYYTLDCTTPTTESLVYTQPLILTKPTVIRCFSVASGKKSSEVVDLTYIVNQNDSLEAVSLVTDPDNLWDYYSGIYEYGPNAEATFPYNNANFYHRWEKKANVSFFPNSGEGFSQNCGIKIFGGLSRALPKKSFSLYFRASYGKGQLDYQLFEDDDLAVYENFVLRNTGQDWNGTLFRDAMLTSMGRELLGLDTQKCRPVVLYLNGEYWGIYFIREKLNANYVAGHYNCAPEDVQIVGANGTGNPYYAEMFYFARDNDLSIQENYDHIASLMDIDNYIDYIVAEIIVGNGDNGNIKFFTYEGGKWRWIMYDLDQSFRSSAYDSVDDHLEPMGTGSGNNFSTRLINSLLKNPEFKKKFLEEIAYQLEYVWTPENVYAYIDRFSGMIDSETSRDFERWDQTSYNTWQNDIQRLRNFIDKREYYMEIYVQRYFNLSNEQMISYGFDI